MRSRNYSRKANARNANDLFLSVKVPDRNTEVCEIEYRPNEGARTRKMRTTANGYGLSGFGPTGLTDNFGRPTMVWRMIFKPSEYRFDVLDYQHSYATLYRMIANKEVKEEEWFDREPTL